MRVVADDLSGAVETAAVLGLRRVALRPREDAVVDLDTRWLPPEEAAERVRAFGRIDFKKIDSQLRGNVAAELEALAGEVIVAPALPVQGRVVRGGVLHVNGLPRESPVPLVDAETDADLDAIVARAAGATLVGSAGLAAALGRAHGAQPLPPATKGQGPLLIAVGTRTAGAQLARLRAAGVPVTDTAEWRAAGWPASASPAGAAGASPQRAGGTSPARAGAASRAGVAARRDVLAVRGKAMQLARVVRDAPPCDLVLTGGATARAVLDTLGIEELELVGQVHYGAVLCQAQGRRVLIRPGSFGGPDSLVEIVEALRG